jgi:hypothetical protein
MFDVTLPKMESKIKTWIPDQVRNDKSYTRRARVYDPNAVSSPSQRLSKPEAEGQIRIFLSALWVCGKLSENGFGWEGGYLSWENRSQNEKARSNR